jgi:hypothetical protein
MEILTAMDTESCPSETIQEWTAAALVCSLLLAATSVILKQPAGILVAREFYLERPLRSL